MEITKNFYKPSTFHIPGDQLPAFIKIANSLGKTVRVILSENGTLSVSSLDIKPTIPKKVKILCDRS
ncbi:MAG: hypothetical protein NTY75_01635 [Candidatus Shapirobacteria bacterium]|nr:hypothetical protein [Candidatus Shapirobacteria bacterium]